MAKSHHSQPTSGGKLPSRSYLPTRFPLTPAWQILMEPQLLYDVANLLLRSGASLEAIEGYRMVVRLKPDMYQVPIHPANKVVRLRSDVSRVTGSPQHSSGV